MFSPDKYSLAQKVQSAVGLSSQFYKISKHIDKTNYSILKSIHTNHTHTHTHTHSCVCVEWGPIYLLSPKWGRVCRVFNTQKWVFNLLTGDQIMHNTHNTWFYPLTGDASYPLYTIFKICIEYIKHVQKLIRSWLAWLYGLGTSPVRWLKTQNCPRM